MAHPSPEVASDAQARVPEAAVPHGPFGRALWRITEIATLIGGTVIVLLAVLTVASVIGRRFFGRPIAGDFEITEIGAAIAVFLFFPYTQITGNHIVAEFFTARFPAWARHLLELVNTIIFMLVGAFLAWRLSLGMLDKLHTGATTMMVDVPLWWGYALAVLGLVLLTVVCGWMALNMARRR